MTEFVEVMKQTMRMCGHFRTVSQYCGKCPLLTERGACMADPIEEFGPVEVERRVMAWAKEHPEVVYPSWHDWHESNFKGAGASLCPGAFMEVEDGYCGITPCDVCRSRNIPAEVAEKLGIKPITQEGKGANENA